MCSPNAYCIFFMCSLMLAADILDMTQENSSLDKKSQIGILIGMIVLIILSLSIIISNCLINSNCCKKNRSSYHEIP